MIRCLHVYRDPALDGPTNMARDEHLLHSAAVQPAAVRIYAWDPPTISLGYFQRFGEVARQPAEIRALALVRRLTGGGAILHDREITYCLVVDDSLPVARQSPIALYRLVHECWRRVLSGGEADGAADDAKVALRPRPPTAAAEVRRCELAPEHFPMPTPRTGPF